MAGTPVGFLRQRCRSHPRVGQSVEVSDRRSERRLRRVLASAVVVVTATVVLASCSSGSAGIDESGKVVGFKRTPARNVARLSLPDHSTVTAPDAPGVPFAIKASPGDLLLVYFGYLTCPDICPVTMADNAAGLADLPADVAEHIEVAFVTVDIERDTGERMNEYLRHFFPNSTIRSLRAVDSYQLNGVSYEFGAQWQVDPHEPGATTYGVAHSGITYVVDDTGQIVWEWPYGTIGPDVAATLQKVYATTYSDT